MTINIYYLDDQAELCAVFKEYIECDEISVSIFTESSEAISKCIDEPPDMIFIDYRLSDTTGETVAQTLDVSIPKILVTGELLAPETSSFLNIINKPYRLSELKKIIQHHFQN